MFPVLMFSKKYVGFLGCFQITELITSLLLKEEKGEAEHAGEEIFTSLALPGATVQEETIRIASPLAI